MNHPETADALLIDRILPQTQCRQCGYTGCRPYADAIADGSAEINRCPPGGDDVIAELASLLQRRPMPLDSGLSPAIPALARIDEVHCIGCTLCIAACPVDVIVGARRLMHTVLADHCTGCGLCLPPCPVDCIKLRPTEIPYSRDRQRDLASELRARHDARMRRLSGAMPGKNRRARSTPPSEDKAAVLQRITQRARQRLAMRNIAQADDGDPSR